MLDAENEIDFWTGLFWGRLTDAEERAAWSAELQTDDPAARAALVTAILGAAESQLA